METLLLKPGRTSRRRCLSTSRIYTLFSTSPISPGMFLPYISHYVCFTYCLYMDHFLLCVPRHRYWLWYSTRRVVCGVVRQVYQKLKQFKVQFLVLQRKTDRSQVILQCLPSNKVRHTPPFCAVTLHFNRAPCDRNAKCGCPPCRWTARCSLCQSNMMDLSLQICATCWKESSSLLALRGA